MRKLLPFFALCPLIALSQTHPETVNFSKVSITDNFWKPRLEAVAEATIPACVNYTANKTGRIRNFEMAAKGSGKHEGIFYDDSDVYKALEAMAYTLKTRRDSALEATCDDWIAKIAAAQLRDGYINTYYTLNGLHKRWTDMSMHEMYCGGHLIEAGIAYRDATGKRQLFDVGIRFADHVDSLFGPASGRHWVTGHQEIELALVKLAKATGEKRYLLLAEHLLEQRGRGYGRGYTWDDARYGGVQYNQDEQPVSDLDGISGHAVRAMYMYSGMTDVAALTGNKYYAEALFKVWEDVVGRNMYLTGGIGSSGRNEGFTDDYDLPNREAYCETCASVGMVFWNQRMNLLTGEAKYADMLERSLYNGALDGISLSGDRFFYSNPLASDGEHERREWFGTACCPSNIARLLASLGSYIYVKSENELWVNLFIGSETTQTFGKNNVAIRQETNYPREGNVKIFVSSAKRATFSLRVRLPGWARGEPVPGGLYRFASENNARIVLKINGKEQIYQIDKGYAVIKRSWQKGDVVELQLPMDARQVVAAPELKVNAGRAAVQRGPLVYCVEGTDNGGEAWNILLPESAEFFTSYRPGLLGGITLIQADLPVLNPAPDGLSVETMRQPVNFIPYYAWANRGPAGMQVWLPRKVTGLKIND